MPLIRRAKETLDKIKNNSSPYFIVPSPINSSFSYNVENINGDIKPNELIVYIRIINCSFTNLELKVQFSRYEDVKFTSELLKYQGMLKSYRKEIVDEELNHDDKNNDQIPKQQFHYKFSHIFPPFHFKNINTKRINIEVKQVGYFNKKELIGKATLTLEGLKDKSCAFTETRIRQENDQNENSKIFVAGRINKPLEGTEMIKVSIPFIDIEEYPLFKDENGKI